MILSDNTICELCQNVDKPMIVPFYPGNVRKLAHGGMPKPIISYGLSSCGYDVVLASDFKIFSDLNGGVIDPKRIDERCLVDVRAITDERTGESYIIVPPNSYALGHTVETFTMPNDICSVVVGKSTYARAGIGINVTPIEPGFSGEVVIEIINATRLPCKIYAGEGIAQFMFLRLDKPCDVAYDVRNGKYQNQTGITLSKV